MTSIFCGVTSSGWSLQISIRMRAADSSCRVSSCSSRAIRLRSSSWVEMTFFRRSLAPLLAFVDLPGSLPDPCLEFLGVSGDALHGLDELDPHGLEALAQDADLIVPLGRDGLRQIPLAIRSVPRMRSFSGSTMLRLMPMVRMNAVPIKMTARGMKVSFQV